MAPEFERKEEEGRTVLVMQRVRAADEMLAFRAGWKRFIESELDLMGAAMLSQIQEGLVLPGGRVKLELRISQEP